MKVFMKSLVENIPYRIGKYLATVPFRYRLGRQYSNFSDLLLTDEVNEEYVLENFNRVLTYAKTTIPFYQKLYKESGVLELKIKTLTDIEKLPIVDKDMIRPYVEEFTGALKLNTGGTSGAPFAFYVDKDAFSREWAHMHKIWSFRDYSYRDIKLTFRGRNLGNKAIAYNPVHNEFIVNTYQPVSNYIDDLIVLIRKHSIKYLHGYPSAIYTFLKELDQAATANQKDDFKACVKCCMLGSEFPVPYMVKYIANQWGLEYISWYGHSEMCILAYDQLSSNEYTPFHSYGYVEVVGDKLIGTSYHNFDMPLIRYDTGDLVSAVKTDSGLLERFSIKEGRKGDFVVDRNGKSIPLTALVFGRHHTIFGYADCIQVRQVKDGEVEFLVTSTNPLNEQEALAMFDLSNVDIDFSLSIIKSPILTASGKMPLKVKE